MAQKQKAITGRKSDGTFAPGNSGGPGRPARATETAYMRAVMEACDLDTWKEIVGRAVNDAKAGDGQARAWLARYLMGKPTERSAPRPSTVIAEEEETDDPSVAAARADLNMQRLLRSIG